MYHLLTILFMISSAIGMDSAVLFDLELLHEGEVIERSILFEDGSLMTDHRDFGKLTACIPSGTCNTRCADSNCETRVSKIGFVNPRALDLMSYAVDLYTNAPLKFKAFVTTFSTARYNLEG